MQEDDASQFHVVIGGVDGNGVLSVAHLLAGAAANQYKHVLWFPNYAASMPDGSECSVVFSSERLDSPGSLPPSGAIVMCPTALKKLEARIQPGGTIVLDSSIMPERTARQDLRVYRVPAAKVAEELGYPAAASLVLLGAFIGATKLLPLEAVKEELEDQLRREKHEAFLAADVEALQRGIDLAGAS